MFKKFIKGMVIGGAALTMAATAAQAQTYEINIYGASAQFTFWSEAAPAFLKAQGCADADIFSARTAKGEVAGVDRDTAMSICVGSDAIDGKTGAGLSYDGSDGNSLIIRYTSKASYDGIRSILGDTDSSLVPSSDSTCAAGFRKMGTVAGNDWVAFGGDYAAQKTGVKGIACKEVTVGASDVSARTFRQASKGMLKGPNGGGYVERDVQFGVNLADPEASSDYVAAQPIVVPFGFFNNVANPINNMTRLMATSIYSGTVSNWNQFSDAGAAEAFDEPMVVCLRHAGSGTHATLDAAIMRGEARLVENEAYSQAWYMGAFPGTPPTQDVYNAVGRYNSRNLTIFFNDGSSDLVKCVKAFPGAVGYADYDKCKEPSTDPESKCYDVDQMTYQGVEGIATNIRNGQYEFWAAQYLYYKAAGEERALIDALVDFTADNSLIPESKRPYWTSNASMNWKKGTDFAWPVIK